MTYHVLKSGEVVADISDQEIPSEVYELMENITWMELKRTQSSDAIKS